MVGHPSLCAKCIEIRSCNILGFAVSEFLTIIIFVFIIGKADILQFLTGC